MNTTTTIQRIQNVTSKGQITLPAAWRKAMGTSQVLVKAQNNSVVISPAYVEEDVKGDSTIFSAQRDNNGKSLPISGLLKALKKIRKEEDSK